MTYSVGGIVVIDTTAAKSSDEIARMIQSATNVPAGAHVVIRVLDRSWPSPAVRDIVRDGAHIGRIDVAASDQDTIKRWCQALRGVDVLALEWQKAG